MNCPSCQEELPSPSRRCANCGVRMVMLESGVIKTSAVLVATGGSSNVYASLRDVPEPLRRRVIDITSGPNSRTIVIADHVSKREIEKAAREADAPSIPLVPRDQAAWQRAWPIAVALLIVMCGAVAVFLARV